MGKEKQKICQSEFRGSSAKLATDLDRPIGQTARVLVKVGRL